MGDGWGTDGGQMAAQGNMKYTRREFPPPNSKDNFSLNKGRRRILSSGRGRGRMGGKDFYS